MRGTDLMGEEKVSKIDGDVIAYVIEMTLARVCFCQTCPLLLFIVVLFSFVHLFFFISRQANMKQDP